MPQLQLPDIPGNRISLTEYGGVGDGITLNTECFREAIEHLSAKGGGTLVVPTGIWLTGPIRLKSHIELHLEKNALLIFTSDFGLILREVHSLRKFSIGNFKVRSVLITNRILR